MSAPDRKRPRSPSEVGEELERLMRQTGTSQYSLSNSSGVSQSAISSVLSGQRTPSGEWLGVVADALGLNQDQTVDLMRAGAKSSGYKIDLT